MTQKIMIDEGKQRAENRIAQLRQIATQVTGLIRAYNELPVLQDLKTAEEVRAFLIDPKGYFEAAILTDSGFKSKVTPAPSGIAGLFGIPYDGMMKKITQTRVTQTEIALFSFDEETMKIELMPESEEQIREESKIYLDLEEEIEEYSKVKQLCDDLNSYCERYQIHASSRNFLPAHLGIRCDPEGQNWKFKPDIRIIRAHLKTVKS